MKKSKSPDQELQEAITKHTEQALADKEDEALIGYPFHIIFAANPTGKVHVTVRWPKESTPDNTATTLASMLHNISEGNWKPPLIESVQKQGVKNNQPEIAGAVLREWGQVRQSGVSRVVCVSPRQVFARNRQQEG